MRCYEHSSVSRLRADPRQRGTAVLLMLFLMAILMLLVASNVRTLIQLKQELRLVERKQMKRLETNSGRERKIKSVAQTPTWEPPRFLNPNNSLARKRTNKCPWIGLRLSNGRCDALDSGSPA